MMDSPTKPNTAKPVGSSPPDVTQAFRATGAATAETTTLMKDSYSAAVKGAQAYNTKFIEFARANTEAAFEFVQKLSSVKSPSEFFELSTIQNAGRASQRTDSASSENHTRDRGAPQDGRK
jgi:hypothetical protein